MSDLEKNDVVTNDQKKGKKQIVFRLLLIVAVCFTLLMADYLLSVRIVDMGATEGLDARGGKVVFHYNKPVDAPRYKAFGNRLKVISRLSEDRLTEIHEIVAPTAYKASYSLTCARPQKGQIFGIFRPPSMVDITTGIEKVSIKGTLPPAGSNPSPETLNNQLAIEFQGEIIGDKYRPGINIPVGEMDYVSLSPAVAGYYRWVNSSLLTFNFTEEKPAFETTYRFDVFPEKFVNNKYQAWVGDATSIEVTTSTNEVYVTDFSLKGNVNWRDKLRIQFSGRMVDMLDVNKIKGLNSVPVTISPEPGGHWVWLSDRTLEFTPDKKDGWPVRQNVVVTVSPNINKDAERAWRGGKAVSHSFYVLPREQSMTNYNLKGETVSLEEDLVVSFSKEMVDKTELHKRFNADNGGVTLPLAFDPPVAGTYSWIAVNKLKFQPVNLWSELTEYTVTLNPEFNPDPRYEWVGSNSFKFKTVENLVQAEFFMTPENRLSPTNFFSDKGRYRAEQDVPTESRLWITFDKDLGRHARNPETLAAAVVFDPPVKGRFSWLSNSMLEFVPDDNWKEKTGYTITLNKTLFHHPQQHFPQGRNSFNFSTAENIVRVPFVSSASVKSDSAYRLDPDKELVFNFSKNMKPLIKVGQVYNSTDLNPASMPVTFTPPIDATYFWENRRRLVVKPVGYWAPETLYAAEFSGKLLPQSEARFEHGRKFFVKTNKNYVSINRLSPQGMVGRRITIDVEFNKNIRPSHLKSGDIDRSGLFSIEPGIKGIWTWLGQNKLQFKPAEPLLSSNDYSLKFDPNLIADKQFTWSVPPREGQSLYPLAEYRFYTPALHIKNADARFEFNAQDLLKQKFYLDIELSAAVDEQALRRHFSIWFNKEIDGKSTEVTLLYTLEVDKEHDSSGIRKFSVVSDWIDRPASDRRIHYKITGGLKPVVGNLDLAADYKSDFLQERPKYITIRHLSWKWQDGRYHALMNLSAPVEPGELKKFLSVSPVAGKQDAAEGLEYELSVDSSGSRGEYRYAIVSDAKPGSGYKFKIEEGLLASDGAFTHETQSFTSTAPDLNRKLVFAGNGSILPLKDLTKVPILSTNVDSYRIYIDKIFPNNVSYYINNKFNASNIDTVAERVYNKWHRVEQIPLKNGGRSGSIRNREIISHLDLSRILPRNRHGLYRISISDSNYATTTDPSRSRWFMATDIGLVARRFDRNMVVWANSLNGLQSLPGIKVKAIDKWNQEIGSAVTDMDGTARIVIDRDATPTHVVAVSDSDYSFLDLRNHRDRLAGYDTEGLPSRKNGLRSFIYSDRGVYRPGDTVHLVSVSRDRDGALPDGLYGIPFYLKLENPTGKEIISKNYSPGSADAYAYDFVVPAEAKTGKWKAKSYYNGNLVGSYTFQVEEFIPNKIKVKLERPQHKLYGGDTLDFTVKANNLFGPPAAGRPVLGRVSFRANYFKPNGYGNFIFGHEDIKFQRIDRELPEMRLDDNGQYTFISEIPEGVDSPIGLTANYSATVIDDGGRGVTNYGSADIHLYSQYVGIRRLNSGVVNHKEAVGFEIVNVDPSGKTIPVSQQQLKVRVYHDKKVTHYRKNERGYYRYVSEIERSLIEELNDPRNQEGKFYYTSPYSGHHVLEVEDLVGKQVSRFSYRVVGNEDYSQIIESGDKVDIKVLKQNNPVNGHVKLEIRAPFPGKLLLVGEREKVLFSKIFQLDTTRKIITLPVKASYLPNFYVSATMLRPVRKGNRQEAIYATGLANVSVFDPAHTPNITLTVPKRANPNGKMTVHVKVDDPGAKKAQFTVAAVDVGILDLTKYQTPSMKGYFNTKRKHEVEHFSMYPMVMPFDDQIKRVITPSGDAPSRALIKKKRVNPATQNRVKSTALWSGLLELDALGNGTVTFDLPDFDGTLRVMAVSFGDKRFASTSKEVLVRDKLVMKPTLPRFMATGDNFSIPITLFNGTELSGDVKVSLVTTDQVKVRGPASKTVTMQKGQEARLDFAIAVGQERTVTEFVLVAEGLGEKTRKIINVPIRDAGNLVTRTGSGRVDQHSPVTINMPDIFLAGTQDMGLKVSSVRLNELQNSLRYLLQYPHGCLEQTTSKLFPLLYFDDMALAAGKVFSGRHTPRYYLEEGIAKIERMQLENGAYAYWEGRNIVNNWAFIYASHFMVEAKRNGLKVSDAAWNNMLFMLNKFVSSTLDQDRLNDAHRGGSHFVYALYVLALADENVTARLNYVNDNFAHMLRLHDRARLAAAFHLAGMNEHSQRLIADLGELEQYGEPYRHTGGSFASTVRDLAIILDTLVTVAPSAPQIPELIESIIGKSRGGRWGTTQENAFAFLAIGKAISESASHSAKATITLGDGSTMPFDRELVLKTVDLLKGDVRIEVSGNGQVTYAWEASGIEADPKELQVDEGVQIRRRFLDKNGDPLDLQRLYQGDLMVAELSVKSLKGKIENLAVTDLLPMGVEIENVRLSTSATLPWIRQQINPDYVDIRDDRINIFMTATPEERRFYYTARAVTVGDFKGPMIYAEAMYNPDIYSKSDGSQVKILLKEEQNQFALQLK